MKVETDAVLAVFWRWAEMVLRWYGGICSPNAPNRSMRSDNAMSFLAEQLCL